MKWHMIGALLAILGGNAAIVAGSSHVARVVNARVWYRVVSLQIAAAGFVAFYLLANYDVWTVDYAPIGRVERAAVYSIMAWQIFSALVLWARPAHQR